MSGSDIKRAGHTVRSRIDKVVKKFNDEVDNLDKECNEAEKAAEVVGGISREIKDAVAEFRGMLGGLSNLAPREEGAGAEGEAQPAAPKAVPTDGGGKQ